MALTEGAKEAVYVQRFLSEFGFKNLSKSTLFHDNCSAQKLAKNPIFHSRSKHIDVRHHFVRDIIENRLLEIEYVPTDQMAADVLRKGLSGPKHRQVLRL